ncbi:MAG: hypothetical protein ABI662_12550 [Dermatophilaceae bacterium]
MLTPAAALARRIVWAMQAYTSGEPQRWARVNTIAKIAMVSDEDFLRAALQVAVDQGWLVVEGGHSVCLTDTGRWLVK